MIDTLLKNNPLIIVDVGASGGIHPRWEEFTSSYKGILFEPDLRAYNKMKDEDNINLTVLNSALLDRKGEVDFHLYKKQNVSSVYPVNPKHINKYPKSNRFRFQKTIKIKTDTLSNQLNENNISEIDFIKVDTQGSEMAIIQGANDYLDNVIGLEVEAEFQLMYKGQPLFDEVNESIKQKGFNLADVKKHYSTNIRTREKDLVSGDALYFKNPKQILSMESVSQEKIVRAICIYLIYGFNDLAQEMLDKVDSIILTPDIFASLTEVVMERREHQQCW
jgi:FkbM family methyltransferase